MKFILSFFILLIACPVLSGSKSSVKSKKIIVTKKNPLVLPKGVWKITITNIRTKVKWVQIYEVKMGTLTHPAYFVNPAHLGKDYRLEARKLR